MRLGEKVRKLSPLTGIIRTKDGRKKEKEKKKKRKKKKMKMKKRERQ